MDVFVNYRTMRTRLLGNGYAASQLGLPVPVVAGGTGTTSLIDRSILYAGPSGNNVLTGASFAVDPNGNLEVGNLEVNASGPSGLPQGTLRVENADLYVDGRATSTTLTDRAEVAMMAAPGTFQGQRPLRWFQRTIDGVRLGLASPWWPAPTLKTYGAGAASGSFAGAVAVHGSNAMVLVPYDASAVGLLDVQARSFESVDISQKNAEFGSVARFRGGVLTRRGFVVLVPWNASNVGVFDPFAKTIQSFPLGIGVGTNHFYGGTLMADGRVALAPHDANAVLLYDERTDLVASVPLPGSIVGQSAKYAGAVLLPSGNVCFVPHTAQRVAVMSADGSSVQEVGNVLTGGNKYVGGVLVPSGKVVFVPYLSSNVGVFDPATGQTTLVAHGLGPGGGLFAGGLLTPDGKVLFVPHDAMSMGLFDPELGTMSYVALPGSFSGTPGKFMGGSIANDGNVYLAPHGHPDVVTYGSYPVSSSVPWHHPYLNTSP